MVNHLRLVSDDGSRGDESADGNEPWDIVYSDDDWYDDDDDASEAFDPRLTIGWATEQSAVAAKAGSRQRLELLKAMTAEQVGELLARQPLTAAALAGANGLHMYALPKAGGVKGRADVAAYLGRPHTLGTTIAGLTPVAYNLVHIAAWSGGTLTIDQAITESGGLDPATLTAAAAEVADHLLSDPDADFVTLLADVPAIAQPPGYEMRRLYAGNAITNDELKFMLANLDIRLPKAKRPELIDAFEAALSNGPLMTKTLSRLGKRQVELFNQIAAHPFGVSIKELGTGWFTPNHNRSHKYNNRYNHVNTPLHDLYDRGLIHVDSYTQRAWAWFEVRRAIAGRMIVNWPLAPDVTPVAIDDTPYVGSVVGMLQGMLDLWTNEPAAGVKSGGLAVRSGRQAAKQLGFNQDHGPTLGRIAIALGLLSEQAVTTGKGRRMETTYQYAAGDPARRWATDSYVQRWVDIVESWVGGHGAIPNEVEQTARLHRVLLGDLARLPVATGIPETRFAEWAANGRTASFGCHALFLQPLHELRMLGLVPQSGAVGLTTLARALISNPAAAVKLMPSPATTFVVQPDHTVLAPNDLDPDIATRLDRLAIQISVGSARMLRLDPARIGREIATGTSVEQVIEFLRTHSSVPMTSAVERFVRDAAGSAAGMTVMAATALLVTSDVRALQRAIDVRAAKLTLIAPTVAISQLTPEKLLAALRAKGLHPTNGALGLAGDVQVIAMPQSAAAKKLAAGTGRKLPHTVQPDAAVLARLVGAK